MKFLRVLVFATLSFWDVMLFASPAQLTYQGRILKSDGTPLEYSNVSFIFQVTDPQGTCVLYQEELTGYNMVNSGGVFDLPIGSGAINFPLSGNFSILDAFNNTTTFACGSCSGYTCANGTSTYTASSGDARKLRVQFYDGSGWKTISPDSVIRSVPYAGYAESAQKLGTNSASDFVLKTGIPTCGAGTFLTWDGTQLTCGGVSGASGGTVTNVSSANSYLTIINNTSTPTLTLNVGTSSNTVAAGNDPRFSDARTPTGTAAGDLSGTYPNPAVAKIQGTDVSSTLPTSGQFFKFDGAKWVGSAIAISDVTNLSSTLSGYQTTSAFNTAVGSANCHDYETPYWSSVSGKFLCQAINVSLAGDVSGSIGATSVDKIKGYAVDFSTAPTNGQVLKYNGTNWAPAADSNAGGTVTSVSASAPLSVTNGTTTPSISITQATSSTNGYLSSADWNTFNNKQAAGNYVTALTGDVTASGPGSAAATIAKLQGSTLTLTTPATADYIRYNGTAFVNSSLQASDLSGTLPAAALPAFTGDVTSSAGSTTLTLASVGTAGTYYKVITDSKGRVTSGSTSLVASDIPNLDWSKITTGKPTTLSGYGITDSLVKNGGGVATISAGVDASKPSSPTSGDLYVATDTQKIYRYNGSSWDLISSASGSGGTISALTSDVSASGSGSVAATVNSVGGSTAANIHTAEVAANASTNTNTASTIVKRDASGNFSAGTITASLTGAASLNVLKAGDSMSGNLTHAANIGDVYTAGSGSNTVTLQGPSGAIGTSYVLRLPAGQGTANQVMTNDGSGNLSWTSLSSLGVTSVTASAPLTSSGGSTPNITISQANTSTNGYLSSTDWNTFNNKQGTSLTSANIWVGNGSNVATAVAPSGDATMTNTGAFTVTAIRGKNISTTAPSTAGQVLRYDGTNWTPNFVSMFDLRSTVTGAQTFGGGSTGCTAGQTLTWTAATDNLSCTNISVTSSQVSFGSQTANTFFAAPNGSSGTPTFRAIASADLPSGTLSGSGSAGYLPYYNAATTVANSPVYSSGGNVGIGATNLAGLFTVVGRTDLGLGYTIANGNGAGGTTNATNIWSPTIETTSSYAPETALRIDRSSDHSSRYSSTFDIQIGSYAGSYSASSQVNFVLANGNTYTPEVNVMSLLANGNVGIGTTSPSDLLTVSQSDASGGVTVINTTSSGSRTPGFTVKNYTGSSSGGSTLLLQSARGTSTAATAVASGDNLGQILFQGLYSGSSYTAGAQIYAQAAETWTGSTAGTNLIFNTIKTGSTSNSETMRIDVNGRVGIGASSVNNLLQVGPNGSQSSKYGVYVGSYYNSAGQAQYVGNWTNSGYWGIGPATSSSDNTIRIGNTSDQLGTWSGTQNLNVVVGGNLGLGTTSPSAPFDMQGSVSTLSQTRSIASASAPDIYLNKDRGSVGSPSAIQNGDALGNISFRGYDGSAYTRGALIQGVATGTPASGQMTADLRFLTNNGSSDATERMRITAAGNVGIGTTSPGHTLDVSSSLGIGTTTNPMTANAAGSLTIAANGNDGFNMKMSSSNNLMNLWAVNGGSAIAFYSGSTQTMAGVITISGSTTSYGTSSDRRLKENIIDTSFGLADLLKIKVHDYNYVTEKGKKRTGFIAQELYQIFPDAVATNGDNGLTPLKQGATPWTVEYGKVTPLIVKSIQDLKAEKDTDIKNLREQVTALRLENEKLHKDNEEIKTRLEKIERAISSVSK